MRAYVAKRSSALVTGAIVLITVLAALPILAGRWPLVIPFWYTAAPLPFAPTRLIPGLLAIAIYLAGGPLLAKRSDRLAIIWSLAGGVAIPVALLVPVGPPLYVLYTRTVSAQATGGFTLGTALTPVSLHSWPQMMPGWRQFLPHIAISLPGWPLVYYGLSRLLALDPGASQPMAAVLRPLQCHNWDWGLNQVSDAQLASAWFGVVSPVWAALTVVPLYAFGRRLAGPEIARRAVHWWPVVPALALFAGTLNTFYPLFSIIVLYLVWRSVTAGPGWGSGLALIGAGLLIGGLLLLNLSLAPLLLLVGLLVILAPHPGDEGPLRHRLLLPLAAGLLLGIGLLVVAGAYAFWVGSSPLEAFLVAMRLHLDMHRSYLPNLGLHTWDFAVYTGLAATALAVACMAGVRPPGMWRLALAFGLTMVVLLISGSAQGEVGRVWIFFMPVVLLLAAAGLQQLTGRQRTLVLGAQVFWLVVLAASHRPVDTWLGPPPGYADVARPPLAGPITPVNARFAGDMRLTGFQSRYDSERRALTIALHWETLHQMASPYYFSVVPVAPNGTALPGVHWQPFSKLYPTTCWQQGSQSGTVVDQIELPLGDAAASGNWWLSLSAFAMQGDEALPPVPVYLAHGLQDSQFGLGPIPVQAP